MPVTPSSLITSADREQLGQTILDSPARLILMERFALISDPRARRGRRHSLVSILALIACATVAVGTDSLTAIEQWADNAVQPVLADLQIRRDPLTGPHQPPSERTLRRVLATLDGDELDAQIGAFLSAAAADRPPEREPLPASRRTEREARRAARRHPPRVTGLLLAYAADGKRLKGARRAGARRAGGGRVHLLGLASHTDGTRRAQHRTPTSPRSPTPRPAGARPHTALPI